MSNRFLYILLLFLNFMLICCAIWSILLEEFIRYHLEVSTLALLSQTDQFQLILFLLEIFDIHVIIVHFCGFRILKCVRQELYTVHLSFLRRIWIFFVSEAVMFNIIKVVKIQFSKKLVKRCHFQAWYCDSLQLTIFESTKISLLNTIEIYDFEISWSIFWNDLQMKGLCCGVNDYQDWQNVIWNDLPIESPINVGGRFIVPLSCCKKEHLTLSSGDFS